MRKRKSKLVTRILREGRDWHAIGIISDERMRLYERACMSPPEPLLPADIRILREQSDLDVYILARIFNTTARQLRRWEQGFGRPKGSELRLLRMVRDRGIESVFP